MQNSHHSLHGVQRLIMAGVAVLPEHQELKTPADVREEVQKLVTKCGLPTGLPFRQRDMNYEKLKQLEEHHNVEPEGALVR